MGKFGRIVNGWKTYLASRKDAKDPKIWVFGEWFGRRCGDNCTYFANYLAEQETDLRLYWICGKNTDTTVLDRRICRLEMDSEEASDILKKAGAIFMNQNFLDVSSNPDNVYGKAVTVDFWHGFPWKKIGHDGDKRDGFVFRAYCALIDPVVEARYFNTFSDLYSEKLKSAFNVRKSRLIQAGAPRNHGFYDPEFIRENREKVEGEIRNAAGITDTGDLKIIAYMPTFRDAGDEVCDLGSAFDSDFISWLEENNTVVIQKAHFVDTEKKGNENKAGRSRVLTMPQLNAATLLAASDALISDYSSCVFDYLMLNRPVIHFVYDYEKYRDKDRGLYFDIEEIRCGKAVCSVEELCEGIRQAVRSPEEEAELRRARREKLMTYESDLSMQAIYQFVREKTEKLGT